MEGSPIDPTTCSAELIHIVLIIAACRAFQAGEEEEEEEKEGEGEDEDQEVGLF